MNQAQNPVKPSQGDNILDIDVQYALQGTDIDKYQVPQTEDFRIWAGSAIHGRKDDAQMSVRIVDESEITRLNQTYRHKNGPTNVLSFPSDIASDIPLPLIGDVVICAPVVIREAQEQGKLPAAHWAHMTVHGTLHLLGYDHETDQDARTMEKIETDILNSLGFDNPYEGQDGVL